MDFSTVPATLQPATTEAPITKLSSPCSADVEQPQQLRCLGEDVSDDHQCYIFHLPETSGSQNENKHTFLKSGPDF